MMFLILDMFLHRVAILSPRFACAILRGKSIRQRKVCGHLNRLLAEPIWHIRVLTAPIGMNMTLNNQSTNQVFDHLLGSYLLAYENGCVCSSVCTCMLIFVYLLCTAAQKKSKPQLIGSLIVDRCIQHAFGVTVSASLQRRSDGSLCVSQPVSITPKGHSGLRAYGFQAKSLVKKICRDEDPSWGKGKDSRKPSGNLWPSANATRMIMKVLGCETWQVCMVY